jgi:hypothetical protein
MLVNKWGLCALSLGLSATHAQTNQFTTPDGTKADLSQTYTVGDTLNVAWQSGWHGSGTRQNLVDLFITGYKSDSYVSVVKRRSYPQSQSCATCADIRVAGNISLDTSGSYRWKIDVPDNIVKNNNGFILRFTKAQNPPVYRATTDMSSSKGFTLKLASTSTSSSTSAKKKKKKKKSLGGILGGVLGGLAALIAGLVALLAALKKKRDKKNAGGTEEAGAREAGVEAAETTTYTAQPPIKYGHYEAAPQEPPQELHGTDVRHELGGGQVAGGVK